MQLARLTAERLQIQISATGALASKPHFAITNEMLALFLSEQFTAETEARDGHKTWMDSSTGSGELETDDIQYVKSYLEMPSTIERLGNKIDRLEHYLIGSGRHFVFGYTDNN
jgi:hypothetical protein